MDPLRRSKALVHERAAHHYRRASESALERHDVAKARTLHRRAADHAARARLVPSRPRIPPPDDPGLGLGP